VTTVTIALLAGLHAASYGAWKDSCVILLSAFALSRIATECYRLFFRHEDQAPYRIPTRVHMLGRVVRSQVLCTMLGASWLAAIYGLYALLRLLPDDLSPRVVGLASGAVFGTSLAIAGAYKDGFIEGFRLRKFVKSPLFAIIGGLLVSFHTSQLEFVALGTIAPERVFNELVFKVMRPLYVPGKFRSRVAQFPEWVERRRFFLGPYALTWLVILGLWAWPLAPRLTSAQGRGHAGVTAATGRR
jgi:hypothetical protein